MNLASAASKDRNRSRKSGFMRVLWMSDQIELEAEIPDRAHPFVHGNLVPKQRVVVLCLGPGPKHVRVPAHARCAAFTGVHGLEYHGRGG